MVIAKKYILNKHFQGDPKPSDFILVEEKLPALNDGEFLIKAEYLALAPYIREYETNLPLGTTMIGFQVAKILESRSKNFPLGKRVIAFVGWRTYTVLDAKSGGQFHHDPYLLPDFGDLPASLGLGVLGMTGNTAYFGLTEVCRAKAGETLVVSGAAGSVGSHVGQIGKILGLKVIGITSSDQRCKWLTEELGFDYAINRKTKDLALALTEIVPEKVDCYFDTVGAGETSKIVLNHLNKSGRVSVYGNISTQNTADITTSLKCPVDQIAVVCSESDSESFIVFRWQDRWFEGIEQNLQWIREGKLKYKETVTEGFDNIFQAFVEMVRGENIGTAIVKV